MNIKIMLADDHKIMRDGLKSLLEEQPDMEVIAEAEDGRSAVRLAEKLRPDVIIMDITMPGLNGVEATRKITSKIPGIKIVALSVHSDKRFVIEMFKAGASAYLPKDSAFSELITALRAVTDSQSYLSPRVTDIVIKNFVAELHKNEKSVFSVLTSREREVLQLLAEGKTTKQMASILGINEKTVEAHRRQIMNKLDIHSIAELTKYAIREGLTSL
ncbi:MAG: response regulator transcription factor [Candidatus Eremiobacteraeota bacterium]|nr:response regulator transcription factor [Candidatus Eremiobacteraeota bacterium]